MTLIWSIFDGASANIKLESQRFIDSLWFPEIVSRQEGIADAHQQTFQWIFDDSSHAVRPWSNFVEWLKTGRGLFW